MDSSQNEKEHAMALLSHSRLFARPFGGRRIGLDDLLSLYRQRRTLAALDDRALDDIGLNRDAAQAEAKRPVWDVPSHWRQ
jgi:uncharacterized protein YjiS (DUF1127 family)